MKRLPIGLQSFSEIRNNGYIYVDKTRQISDLLHAGKYYFFARPRRFGKSVMLSTIAAIFEGKKELFNGLWLEDKWDWGEQNPVIHIRFNGLGYHELGLKEAIHRVLHETAKSHGLILASDNLTGLFSELLEKIYAKSGKVVLLIDEYDKPIIDYLEKETRHQAFENQAILRNFYSIIKNSDEYLRFLLITGVSKFSRVSIFSELNNLRDITISPKFGDLVGYTQSDVEHYFEPYLEEAMENLNLSRIGLLSRIKKWYNGYSWNGRDLIYNPFSLLNFMAESEFGDYWFKTGTPTFLIKLLKENSFFEFDNLLVNKHVFDSYDLNNLEIRSLLFQTGYLTIKAIDRETQTYQLGYPNMEVSEAMYGHLLGAYSEGSALDSTLPVTRLRDAFNANDLKTAMEILHSLFKSIPSQIFKSKAEFLYHAITHIVFRYLGLFIQSEINTSDGRIDAVIRTATHIYILEFKINKSSQEAIAQILTKDYKSGLNSAGKTIVALGINFSSKTKGVESWEALVLD